MLLHLHSPPDLLDLILKLCWPSASPGDELKSPLLLTEPAPASLDTRAVMVCSWESQAGLMGMTQALRASLLLIIPQDTKGWRVGCPQKCTFPSADHQH